MCREVTPFVPCHIWCISAWVVHVRAEAGLENGHVSLFKSSCSKSQLESQKFSWDSSAHQPKYRALLCRVDMDIDALPNKSTFLAWIGVQYLTSEQNAHFVPCVFLQPARTAMTSTPCFSPTTVRLRSSSASVYNYSTKPGKRWEPLLKTSIRWEQPFWLRPCTCV